MSKILITGTGRAGTSFLVQLLTNLGEDTGFPKGIKLDPKCNAGLEHRENSKHRVIKNPEFALRIPDLNKKIEIEHIFIPIRELAKTALSRASIGSGDGGLWNASDMATQEEFNAKLMYKLIFDCNRLGIEYTLIDFDGMMNDSDYLFSCLYKCFDFTEDEFKACYYSLIDHSKIHF